MNNLGDPDVPRCERCKRWFGDTTNEDLHSHRCICPRQGFQAQIAADSQGITVVEFARNMQDEMRELSTTEEWVFCADCRQLFTPSEGDPWLSYHDRWKTPDYLFHDCLKRDSRIYGWEFWHADFDGWVFCEKCRCWVWCPMDIWRSFSNHFPCAPAHRLDGDGDRDGDGNGRGQDIGGGNEGGELTRPRRQRRQRLSGVQRELASLEWNLLDPLVIRNWRNGRARQVGAPYDLRS